MRRIFLGFILLALHLHSAEPAVGETVWIGGRYFQFAGKNPAGERLLLLCGDGSLRAFSPSDRSCQYSRAQPPANASLKAVAFDALKNFWAQDAEKKWWQWSGQDRAFRRSNLAPEIKNASPSLSGFGLAGDLVLKN